MTPEEIEQLQPGPELNALIAKKVMAWKWTFTRVNPDGSHTEHYDVGLKVVQPLPDFSGSIAAAWLVVEQIRNRFRKRGYLQIRVPRVSGYDIYWHDLWLREDFHYTSGKTFPEAICKIALKTVMGEKE